MVAFCFLFLWPGFDDATIVGIVAVLAKSIGVRLSSTKSAYLLVPGTGDLYGLDPGFH